MDKVDYNIIRELQKNGRITMTELSEKVGVSKTPCIKRIKRLHSEGYIKGYTAIIDPVKLGLGHIAFVQVTLGDTRSKALDEFNTAVRQIPDVVQCHMMAAGFDYLLKVRTSNMQDYRAVLGEKISTLPAVTHTSTFAVMETVIDPSGE